MKRNTIIGGLLLLAFIAIIAFSTGYRFDGLKIVKAGKLEIIVPYADSTITIDGKHSGYAHSDGEAVIYRNLSKGAHTVIVSHEGRYPWIKEVVIPYSSQITLRPFNIKTNSNSTIINATTDEFKTIKARALVEKAPTKSTPTISGNKEIAVYVDNSSIIVEWLGNAESAPELFCENTVCTRSVTLIPTALPIHSALFYPERNDIIIISTTGGVYALEVSKGPNQNFQPIVQADNARILIDSNILYALDGDVLGKVTLD